MAQAEISEQPDTHEASEKLRFEGTVEVSGAVTGQMLSVLFGEESNVNGKLFFKGAVQIDGTFSGAVTTDDVLIVGERATIHADISCGSAVVNGEVTGNITARESVSLQGHAQVKGDITSPSLSVERGVLFDGSSRMGATAAKTKRGGHS
ncbi:MAG TPA: polymer-forming cytoskeletal protein [Candidatus Limnocylindria bacterium]|jgi:cytoskeletal protein CcmA (bactofilin family)